MAVAGIDEVSSAVVVQCMVMACAYGAERGKSDEAKRYMRPLQKKLRQRRLPRDLGR
eukprot:SAG22_NODE_16868_length_316_cov_0.576037_1_plen_57_part_10